MNPVKRLFLLLLLLAGFATGALADYGLKIIPLQHRSAEEVIPVIRPLLAPDEAVSGVRYQLFLRASDRSTRAVEQVLAELDRPRRNLRVIIRQGAARDVSGAGQGVSGEVRSGGARIVIPGRQSSAGGAVIGGDGARYQIYRSTGSQRQESEQFINVLEGMPAFIQVGESVPYVQRFVALAGRRLAVVEGVQFREVVTGFEVLARVAGDRVELEIAPRLSFIGDRGTQVVDFQELRTTVSVRPGEWVDLGGATVSRDEVSSAIWETAGSQSSERRTIMLKVDEGP